MCCQITEHNRVHMGLMRRAGMGTILTSGISWIRDCFLSENIFCIYIDEFKMYNDVNRNTGGWL